MADALRHWLGAPYPLKATNSAFGFTNFVLDAATDALEFIIQVSEADTITHVGFRIGVVTGTSPVYQVSLQGVAGNGNPDGVIKGGGSPASATFTPTAAQNGTWQWIALANSYAATRGEFLALVIAYSSGTVDGANNASFTSVPTNTDHFTGFPYVIQNNAGVRSRQTNIAVWGIRSATSRQGKPWQSWFNTNISSDTTPDEQALRFLAPAALSQYTVAGVRAFIRTPASGKTVTVALWDGTTLLQSVTVDSDALVANNSTRLIEAAFQNAVLAQLTGGNVYRISFAPVQTAANFSLIGIGVPDALDLLAWPGETEWYLSTRTNAGAWTDDPLTRPIAEIQLADITAASSGSSGINPVLTAGGGHVRPRRAST